jgi:cullin-associated NEDD8-dissociated protein 1
MLSIMLKDDTLENARLALTTLNSAAHNKPAILLPHLPQVLPYLMAATEIKPNLIRELSYGPFKYKIDDGLEIRKSAYETLYALMDTPGFAQLNILDFFERIIDGLKDDHDIRALCTVILGKLVVLDPLETERRLDSIALCFRAVLSTKLKDNAVKQEIEKLAEARRQILSCSLLLRRELGGIQWNGAPAGEAELAGQAGQREWQDYWEWINKEFGAAIADLRDADDVGGGIGGRHV